MALLILKSLVLLVLLIAIMVMLYTIYSDARKALRSIEEAAGPTVRAALPVAANLACFALAAPLWLWDEACGLWRKAWSRK